ncbi:MAG: YihY/virulence factor BrkB family protein [Verrucomicrobiota bacterium]
MSLKSLWTTVETWSRCVWKILVRTVAKYVETDGELRAASFGYYAFFALFPLLLLFISLGTMIWGDKNMAAAQVLGFVNTYIPVSPNEQNVVAQTVNGVLASRGQAGIVAVLALAWSSLRFFQALVHGVNRAWGMREYSWWHLPLANLGMVAILGSTLLLGVVAPVIMKAIEVYWAKNGVAGYEVLESSLRITRLILPWLVLFYGLVMFYKYAPRRKTHIKEVWVGALTVTIFLQLLSKAFVFYAANFAKFNALYGTLGSVVAVLMWIYLSGSLIIFGGCLCAAQKEILSEGKEEEEDPAAAI